MNFVSITLGDLEEVMFLPFGNWLALDIFLLKAKGLKFLPFGAHFILDHRAHYLKEIFIGVVRIILLKPQLNKYLHQSNHINLVFFYKYWKLLVILIS